MISAKTREKVKETMEEVFLIVDGVRITLEEQVDMDGGIEAESDNDIYNAVVDCGMAIVSSLSLITMESDEKVMENLTKRASTKASSQPNT